MNDKKANACTCPECFGRLVITENYVFECFGCRALYLPDAALAAYDIFVPVLLPEKC